MQLPWADESLDEPRGAAGVAVRSEPLPRSKQVGSRPFCRTNRHAIRSAVTVTVATHGLAELQRRNPAAVEYMSAAVIFESGRLLRKYPHLNAYATNEQACFYEEVNIGYALDAGLGLKVPVLRAVDGKALVVIIEERRQFLAGYHDGEIPHESLSGGTFTISDLSADGVFSFDPLIIEAQSGILGIGAEFDLNGLSGKAYNLILAFDHRLIEGRMAAQFLGELKVRLQAHEEVILGGAEMHSTDASPEPYCSRCLSTLSEIQRLKGCLVPTIGKSKSDSKPICSICLAAF